jgi:hypothetical protein
VAFVAGPATTLVVQALGTAAILAVVAVWEHISLGRAAEAG